MDVHAHTIAPRYNSNWPGDRLDFIGAIISHDIIRDEMLDLAKKHRQWRSERTPKAPGSNAESPAMKAKVKAAKIIRDGVLEIVREGAGLSWKEIVELMAGRATHHSVRNALYVLRDEGLVALESRNWVAA